jgi:two-component system LytT family response regulator
VNDDDATAAAIRASNWSESSANKQYFTGKCHQRDASRVFMVANRKIQERFMEDLQNVLVVDDEALSRERVTRMLRALNPGARVDHRDSVRGTLDALASNDYDLLLLDIQMPDGTGFDVISEIGASQMPPTIFITAYDAYAIKAFEVSAVDYLLKPFTDARLEAALVRCRRFSESDNRNHESPLDGLRQLYARGTWQNRFLVKTKDVYEVVAADQVDYIEAANNYVRIFVRDKSYLMRGTLREVENCIDPLKFIRIHRSVVVNIDRVRQLRPWFSGDFIVVLDNGKELKMSRTYRENLQHSIRGSLKGED